MGWVRSNQILSRSTNMGAVHQRGQAVCVTKQLIIIIESSDCKYAMLVRDFPLTWFDSIEFVVSVISYVILFLTSKFQKYGNSGLLHIFVVYVPIMFAE